MRVRGNVIPEILTIEPYPAREGYAEVRLRENIREVTETDTAATMFEYDEYAFYLKVREGLQEDIESNFNDWVVTGRTLEVDERASALCAAKQTNAEYESALSEIETALGVNA